MENINYEELDSYKAFNYAWLAATALTKALQPLQKAHNEISVHSTRRALMAQAELVQGAWYAAAKAGQVDGTVKEWEVAHMQYHIEYHQGLRDGLAANPPEGLTARPAHDPKFTTNHPQAERSASTAPARSHDHQ